MASIVEGYQSLRKINELSCAGTQTVVFTLVLEYADGRETLVKGDLGACGKIGDGYTLSTEGGSFLEHALSLWDAQRTAGYSHPIQEIGECTTSSLIRASAADAARGAWCSRDTSVATRQGGGPWRRGTPLPAAVIDEVVAQIFAAAAPANTDWNTEAFIMLEDEHGDAVALEWLGNGDYAFYDGGERKAFVPSAELARQLRQLAPDRIGA